MKKIFMTIFGFFIIFLSHSQNFISEIKNFEKQDSISMPPFGQILLVGSSTFRFWVTSKEDLAGYPTINRGFGGSQMSDVNYYFDRIVSKYQPKMILVYEGDNDLTAGESPEMVFEDFKIFAEKVKLQLPNSKVGYCSIRPSIARTNLKDKQIQANQLIKDFCKKNKGFYFIDFYKEYFLPNGNLMPDVFVADKLHLNKQGYIIWAKTTRKFLKKRFKS
jgi:lysophospholipase L1-like esterase